MAKTNTRSNKTKRSTKAPSKARAGTGGRKGVGVSWKRFAPGILLIAVVGGFLVYRSFAATALLAIPGQNAETILECTRTGGSLIKETGGSKRNANVCQLGAGDSYEPVIFGGRNLKSTNQAQYLDISQRVTTTGHIKVCYFMKKSSSANATVTFGNFAPGSTARTGTNVTITNVDYSASNSICDPVPQRAGSSRPFVKVVSGEVRIGSVTIEQTASPSTPGSGRDSFGVNMLYPTLSGGKVWSSKWNNGVSRSFSSVTKDPQDNWFTGRGNGSYSTSGNGILNISGANPRMYVQDPALQDQWRNVEITMYFNRISDGGTAYAGMVAVARTSHINETVNQCDSRGTGARFRNDGRIDFEKETAHPNSVPVQNKAVNGWNNSTYNKWIGYKLVIYDLPNGQVKLENYIDTTDGVNGGTWEKVNEMIDNGSNFGVGGVPCVYGMNPALPLTAAPTRSGSESGKPNISVYFRSDNVNTNGLQYKKGSIREIQAPAN
jgi:hypothetical protein